MNKILIADDHEVMRLGLKNCIKSILPHSSIDEVNNGNAAFEKIKQGDYALIILDINMHDTDSVGLVSNILSLKPESKILMYSMNPEEVYAKKYLNLGAMGYLGKDNSLDEMKKAINKVLSNKRYVSPSIMEEFTENLLGKKPANQNPFNCLSLRELEITRHLMKGESVSQLCSFLHIHSSTVGTHKQRILKKLHCNNIVNINELASLYNFS